VRPGQKLEGSGLDTRLRHLARHRRPAQRGPGFGRPARLRGIERSWVEAKPPLPRLSGCYGKAEGPREEDSDKGWISPGGASAVKIIDLFYFHRPSGFLMVSRPSLDVFSMTYRLPEPGFFHLTQIFSTT
jgi:hypothetical protein